MTRRESKFDVVAEVPAFRLRYLAWLQPTNKINGRWKVERTGGRTDEIEIASGAGELQSIEMKHLEMN